MSFEYTIPNLAGNDIVALSTTNAVPGNDINGLLYLPELDTRGTCHDKLYDLVPRNTTTQSNLPNGDAFWTWVAVAPWISPECFLEFLHAAEDDDLRAFIFYLPDNSTTVPDPKDPRWLTSDGKWRSWARFPVYAISGYNGAILTDALSRYSGNLTDVPYGHMLANEFPLQSYVRLAASLTIGKYLDQLLNYQLLIQTRRKKHSTKSLGVLTSSLRHSSSHHRIYINWLSLASTKAKN